MKISNLGCNIVENLLWHIGTIQAYLTNNNYIYNLLKNAHFIASNHFAGHILKEMKNTHAGSRVDAILKNYSWGLT